MADEHRPEPDPRHPYVVAPEPARDVRRSRTSLAVVGVVSTLVVGLTTWGLLAPPPPPPVSPQAPTPVPSTAPGTEPPATPDRARAGRDDDAVLEQLARRAGWADCPIWRDLGTSPVVGPDLVAWASSAQGIVDGRLEVDDLQGGTVVVWLGDNVQAAVDGLGGTVTVRAGAVAWTALDPESEPPVAVRLDAAALDDGTVYWQERVRAMPAPYCIDGAATDSPARVVEVAAGADGLSRLFTEMGIDACRTWQRMETASYPSGRDVDEAMDAVGVPPDQAAWVSLPLQPGYGARQVRTWVGGDPAAAGARHGSALVVLQREDPATDNPAGRAWLAVTLNGRPAAIQLRIVETPAGRVAWMPTPNAAGVVGACGVGVAGTLDETDVVQPVDEAAGPAVDVLRGGTDALAMLMEHFGWTGCRLSGSSGMAEEPFQAVLGRLTQTADATAGPDGWLTLEAVDAADPIRAWLGDDVVALARAAAAPAVAADGSAAVWLADTIRAGEWRSTVTPGGRTAWVPTGAVIAPDASCPGALGTPDSLEGVRSLTCWTDRARCLEATRAAMRVESDAFTPGTAVAAGIGESCEPGTRCPWVGPNMPVIVTAAPPGWTSSEDVRAFSAGWRPVAQPFRELPRDEITSRILAMASRPSRDLPVAPAGDVGAVYCPASGITGALRGSPWDLRVAWVGLSTVRWPHGFTARFTPDLELLSPQGTVFRAGGRVQASGLVGDEPVFEACQVTGTVIP